MKLSSLQLLLCGLVCAAAIGPSLAGEPSPASALAPSDLDAIHAVHDAYRDGWLGNDREQVMDTLNPDATLLPSGLAPIRGERNIREFWWPATSPPTKILSMQQVVDEIRGTGTIAYATGTIALTFSWEDAGKTVTASSTSSFLDVLSKDADGRWRIDARMWSNRTK